MRAPRESVAVRVKIDTATFVMCQAINYYFMINLHVND